MIDGHVQTPKYVMLQWVIKTLTGNAELIKILNGLGRSCLFSQLEETETVLCFEKNCNASTDAVPFP